MYRMVHGQIPNGSYKNHVTLKTGVMALFRSNKCSLGEHKRLQTPNFCTVVYTQITISSFTELS